MKLLSERLKWAMSEKSKRDGEDVIPADIARATKSSATSVNYWLNDANGIGAVNARRLGDYLGVNAFWLETGSGDPLDVSKKESAPMDYIERCNAAEKELLNAYRLTPEPEQQLIIDTAKGLPKIELPRRFGN